MNKIFKIFLILAIIVMIFNIIPIQVSALADPLTNPSDWKPDALGGTGTHYEPMIKKILGYISTIGVIISVIVLMVIGLRYMLGSVEEKAEYKKTMMGYVIGAIMLFAVTTIPNILYTIGTSII